MKILYVTTIAETMRFFPEHIKMLQKEGHVVELACNCDKPYNESVKELQCKTYHIPFSRKVGSLKNIKSYSKIKKLIEREKYDVVHTHTPNASVIVRIVCRRLRKSGLKVLYTAHGFHFYKGAPIKNWIFFFPVEYVCAFWTDVLITINKEDYNLAKHYMKAKRVEYVPGIGVNIEKFHDIKGWRDVTRNILGVKSEELFLSSVGELNVNKNHKIVIRAIAKIKNSKIHYFIIGEGKNRDYLEKLSVNLNVKNQVHLLGFRNDVEKLYSATDLFVFPSYREGLSVALMEAMASELPVVCSKIRGNIDLIDNGKGGFLCSAKSEGEFKQAIEIMLKDRERMKKMGTYNRDKIREYEKFSLVRRMKSIYINVMDN